MPQITQLSDVLVSQLFWLAIVFGFIFVGIGRGILPKIRSAVVARDEQVAKDLRQAQEARAEAEATEREWAASMDEARREAARIAQNAAQESARHTDDLIREALEEIDARVERARLRIRSAVEAARLQMEDVTVQAAQEMVEQLTGLKIDKSDAAKAVATEIEIEQDAVQNERGLSLETKPKQKASIAG